MVKRASRQMDLKETREVVRTAPKNTRFVKEYFNVVDLWGSCDVRVGHVLSLIDAYLARREDVLLCLDSEYSVRNGEVRYKLWLPERDIGVSWMEDFPEI